MTTEQTYYNSISRQISRTVFVQSFAVAFGDAVAACPVWNIIQQLDGVGVALMAEILTNLTNPIHIALGAAVVIDRFALKPLVGEAFDIPQTLITIDFHSDRIVSQLNDALAQDVIQPKYHVVQTNPNVISVLYGNQSEIVFG